MANQSIAQIEKDLREAADDLVGKGNQSFDMCCDEEGRRLHLLAKQAREVADALSERYDK
jgi:hypothetical protein